MTAVKLGKLEAVSTSHCPFSLFFFLQANPVPCFATSFFGNAYFYVDTAPEAPE